MLEWHMGQHGHVTPPKPTHAQRSPQQAVRTSRRADFEACGPRPAARCGSPKNPNLESTRKREGTLSLPRRSNAVVTLTRGSIHPAHQRSSMAGPKSDVVLDVGVDSSSSRPSLLVRLFSSEFNSISFKQLDMGAYEGSPAERVTASISQPAQNPQKNAISQPRNPAIPQKPAIPQPAQNPNLCSSLTQKRGILCIVPSVYRRRAGAAGARINKQKKRARPMGDRPLHPPRIVRETRAVEDEAAPEFLRLGAIRARHGVLRKTGRKIRHALLRRWMQTS
jgi:hypothetical protein